MKSAIYHGRVVHHRFSPKQNRFSYKLCMLYIDLDELGSIFEKIPIWRDDKKKSLAYFKRTDYLMPHDQSLKSVVRKLVLDRTGSESSGPIRMLTNFRILGYCMNPVTFYYCFDESGSQLQFVVADINNTPWDERYQYVLDLRKSKCSVFPKEFHISPFMGMSLTYDWLFKKPSSKLYVRMDIFSKDPLMKVNLYMQRKKINRKNMLTFLIRYGLINYKVIFGIYWQAFKLYCKRIPFYNHPGSNND